MKTCRCCVDCRSEYSRHETHARASCTYSFSSDQSTRPRAAHHGMRNLTSYIDACYVSAWRAAPSPGGRDHLNDAADVMPAITGVSGCSALDDIELINVFLGVWVPYRRNIFQMWSH